MHLRGVEFAAVGESEDEGFGEVEVGGRGVEGDGGEVARVEGDGGCEVAGLEVEGRLSEGGEGCEGETAEAE